jgi:DNA-binding protein WhiA
MTVTTESEDVVFRLSSLLSRCFGAVPNISVSGSKKDLFTVTIEPKEKRDEILNSLGYFGFRDGDSIIKYHNIEDNCCKSAFLRGVFLSSATFSNPNREYHAEIPVNNANLAKEIYLLLLNVGLAPKLSARGKKIAIYFTGSENVSDILAYLGAGNFSLKLADITVYKDFRNRQNRLTNCETANITKTVNAAVNQCMAIKKLKESGAFNKLPLELQQVGNLRLEYDQASLKELCEFFDGEISKSGLNHRLNRLITLANNINK